MLFRCLDYNYLQDHRLSKLIWMIYNASKQQQIDERNVCDGVRTEIARRLRGALAQLPRAAMRNCMLLPGIHLKFSFFF